LNPELRLLAGEKTPEALSRQVIDYLVAAGIVDAARTVG
jgi:hypothetical protein